jgi:hypothetical protein
MNRFERVVQILDEAIGGPIASIPTHGTFWRGLIRDQFVAFEVFDRSLIAVGRGGDSNLVKALRGEFPFGKNTGTPAPIPVPTPMAVSPESAVIGLLESKTEIGDSNQVRIPVTVPEGSSRITVNVWERFGRHVSQIIDESNPAAGARTVEWDAADRSGSFIVRVTVDDNSESQIIWVRHDEKHKTKIV